MIDLISRQEETPPKYILYKVISPEGTVAPSVSYRMTILAAVGSVIILDGYYKYNPSKERYELDYPE